MDGLLLKYFVLRPKGSDAHAKASREAMKAYAIGINHSNPKLAIEILDWAQAEEAKAADLSGL